jgi:Glycosyl hydrolases family 39
VLAGALVALLLGGVLSQSSGSPSARGPLHCPEVPTGPAPARHTALTIGLNSMWNNDCNLAAATSSGVTFERLEVDWSSIERRPGRWDFSAYDKQFAVAARHGITMLPLLMNVPGWAGSAWNALPANTSAYSTYVARVVRRYGPHGSFWRAHRDIPARPATWFEIWNEPYLSQFSAGGVNPGRYARLFKSAAMAGRRADPSARFLIEADLSGLAQDGSASPWVGPMYAAVPDLGRWADGVAMHPYSGTDSPNAYNASDPRGDFKRIVQIHRQFAAHGGASKPFWITEVGWSTCPADPTSCVNEPDQAAYLKRVFQLVKSDYSWVKAVFPYNYRDGPEGNGTDREAWFGLIRRAGQPKPAWNVLRAAARG